MRTLQSIILTLLLSISPFAAQPASSWAEGSPEKEQPLAPYFFVKNGDPGTDLLPLKSTSVDANIAGVIADVTLTQTYRNDGKRPIEARYIFPGSTNAAVYGMTMQVGERKVFAQIKEKEEARQTYEKAKAQGKTSSLLEQQRVNVFEMNVANILPGDEVKVELKYTELLVPQDRTYEFVFPAVVGPRYSNITPSRAAPNDHWLKNPYLHQGEEPYSDFRIAVRINGGLPLKDVASTSHEVAVAFENATSALVTPKAPKSSDGNRDFIVRYHLADSEVQSGLLLYEGENENFFAALLEPPFRVTPDQIPAREYIFVVDVSGSMWGFPLDVSKELLKNLLRSLRGSDTFNVLLFSGRSALLSPNPLPASSDNIDEAIRLISSQQGGGGTELLPALHRALNLPADEHRSRSIIVVTDGYVAVEKESFELIRNSLGQANLFAFGIGTSVNRYIIEGMARSGYGEPFIVTRPSEAPGIAARFTAYISSPVLTHAQIQFDGFGAYDVEPKSIPDVFADRPVVVFGKWKGAKQGSISLSGITGKGRFEKKLALDEYEVKSSNAALKYLWARHKIRMLSDYGKINPGSDVKPQITSLGLTYNLLTDFTSFVAVDEVVRRNPNDPLQGVRQPLPMPQGVSDLAVGESVPTAPEPETWALLIVAALILAMLGSTKQKGRNPCGC